jgi:ATP-dependent RNA helicase RhlE
MKNFKDMKLNDNIQSALDLAGYVTPTPIQLQAIPHLLEGRDLLGIAQTGTGKTAAFALPLLNRLASNKIKAKPDRTRALILTPTRELASQIHNSIRTYGKAGGIYSTVVFGGVGIGKQVQAMSNGVDILVATPGRLLDLMSNGHVRYDQLEVFILDEADRMLDMGFINDVKKIISYLPPIRQTLLFSATMPSDIARLASSLLTNPVKVEVTPESTTVEKISQSVMHVIKERKIFILEEVLKNKEIECALVFTRTKHGADKVVKHLQRIGVLSAAIHGNKSQNAREKALMDFKKGTVRVLVATDIAARGIDVPGITHVINFNLPEEPESYVHRIGRTARAGKEGVAISFCAEDELKLLKQIEKVIGKKIPVS